MKVEYNEETPVRKSLAFEIEPEVVEQEIETRAKHYAKRVKIPGFRPGKIPVAVIKQRFRGQVLEDVVESLVNKAVFDELEGRGLRPLATQYGIFGLPHVFLIDANGRVVSSKIQVNALEDEIAKLTKK